MHIEFTARGTTPSPKLQQLATTELARIEPILGRTVGAHVILTEDKHRRVAEVTVKTAHDSLVARCEGTDMLVALHDALRTIEQQGVRHKERKLSVERHAKPDSAEPLIEVDMAAAAGRAAAEA